MATKVYTPTATVVNDPYTGVSPHGGFSGIDGSGDVLATTNGGDYYFTNDIARSLGWTPVDDSTVPLTALVISATFRNQVNVVKNTARPFQIKAGVAQLIPPAITAPTGLTWVDSVATTDVGGGPLTVAGVLANIWGIGFESGSGAYNNYWATSRLTLVFTLPIPTVTTVAADNVNVTTATLHGTLNPNGATTTYPVSYQFQYGPTTGYGYTTPLVTGLTGSVTSSVAAALTGLAGSSTYHFRLVATTADGPTYGADLTFGTLNIDVPIMVL